MMMIRQMTVKGEEGGRIISMPMRGKNSEARRADSGGRKKGD